MFEVILSSEAREFYLKVDRALASKLSRCFAQLERDPIHHNSIRRLTGDLAGRYRYRVGDWRVIYRVSRSESRVYVATIAHRSEVYE